MNNKQESIIKLLINKTMEELETTIDGDKRTLLNNNMRVLKQMLALKKAEVLLVRLSKQYLYN